MICGWIFRMTRGLRRGWEVLGNERGAEEEAGCGALDGETFGGRSATVSLSEFYGSVTRSLMSGQPQLYSSPGPAMQQEPSNGDEPAKSNGDEPGNEPGKRTAPVWLQRLSLFVLVLFCV